MQSWMTGITNFWDAWDRSMCSVVLSVASTTLCHAPPASRNTAELHSGRRTDYLSKVFSGIKINTNLNGNRFEYFWSKKWQIVVVLRSCKPRRCQMCPRFEHVHYKWQWSRMSCRSDNFVDEKKFAFLFLAVHVVFLLGKDLRPLLFFTCTYSTENLPCASPASPFTIP